MCAYALAYVPTFYILWIVVYLKPDEVSHQGLKAMAMATDRLSTFNLSIRIGFKVTLDHQNQAGYVHSPL